MEEKPGMGRRRFIAMTGLAAGASAGGCSSSDDEAPSACPGHAKALQPASPGRVALAKTGSAESNARALLDAWGGAESLFGPDDVVVLKVNAQWYAQGMTNTDVAAELIRAILDRPKSYWNP